MNQIPHSRLTTAMVNLNDGVKAIIGNLAAAQDGLSKLMELNREVIRMTNHGVLPEYGVGPRDSSTATPDLTVTNSGVIDLGQYAEAVEEPAKPTYRISSAGQTKLALLHPKLAAVVRLAINLTDQDFTVFETVRTLDQQKANLAKGTTRTLKSKHLKQADGYAHAVDLVPYINGRVVWDWDGCYKIACAMDKAATQLGAASNIRWGGAWDRVLADFGGDSNAYAAEVQSYRKRKGGSAFLDGPHYEWIA